jgi:ribosome-binding factor A
VTVHPTGEAFPVSNGMNYRPLRVGKLIKEELGKIILREMEFPGALVTVTGVDVEKKLEIARVKLSVLPSEFAEKALKIMKSAQGRLQHLLNQKLNIKPMPRIEFGIDHGLENAAAVEKLLLEDNNK